MCLLVVLDRLATCASCSGSELVNVLLCDSFHHNSSSFKWHWRDWNWVHSNFWSAQCPSVVCHSPRYSNLAVDGFLVPSAPGVPKSGKFRFCRPKSLKLWVVFHFLPSNHQSLRLSQPNNVVDRKHARIHRTASDMLLVTRKSVNSCRFWDLHGASGIPIGALLFVLQQWLWVASVCHRFLVG